MKDCWWLPVLLATCWGDVGAARMPEPFESSASQGPPCPTDFCQGQECPIGNLLLRTVIEPEFVGWKTEVDEKRAELGALSAVVGVVQGGGDLLQHTDGYVSVEAGASRVNEDSRYLLASITKLFNAVLLYRARDAGLLPQGLDTMVRDILPGYLDPKALRSPARGITLRALAMHTSGLPRDCKALPCSADLALDTIANCTLLHMPFEKTSYSNLGTALIGNALEKVMNKTWADMVEDEIFAVLGMSDSGVLRPRDTFETLNIVKGLDPISGEVQPLPVADWITPSGYSYSSMKDFKKFLHFLLGYHKDGHLVLARSSVNEMLHTAFVQDDGISYVTAGTFEGFRMHNRVAFTKAGCVAGYRTDMIIVPSLGLGLFVAIASTCDLYGDGDAMAHPLAYKLIRRISLAFEAAGKKAETPLFAQEYIGRYCDPKNPTRIEMYDSFLPSRRLVMVNSPLAGTFLNGEGYPYVLSRVHGKKDIFKVTMGDGSSSALPKQWTGCSSKQFPRHNLCNLTCNRRMGRSDGIYIKFVRNTNGKIVGLSKLDSVGSCLKLDHTVMDDIASVI